MEGLQITMEGLDYRVDFYLSGVKVSTLITNDVGLVLKECDNKTRMMLGLAKGKVYTTIAGNH